MKSILFVVAVALGAAACGDNLPAAPADAMPLDADPQALAPCLDKPTDLARPPIDRLPCDLLPPGFGQ